MLNVQVNDVSPPNDCIHIWNGETYEDYFLRLFGNKDKYNLTCSQIASILNEYNGTNYDESTYRKHYRSFVAGMKYERTKENWKVVNRILCISDLHIPFNLPVDTFYKYKGEVDTIVINGDICDCQSLSSFSKKYRVSFMEEMILARDYIINLIDELEPKDVYITKGNHEHRMVKYLSDRLNDDIMNIMPDSPIDLIINDGFKDNDRRSHTTVFYEPLKKIFEGICNIHYDGNWFVCIGNIMFAHPLTYSSSMMKTTEKAVNFFLREKQYRHINAVILGHTHKLGYYMSGDIRMYEQGCCCKTEELDYADGKLSTPQQKGYMYICLDNNGDIIESKTDIISLS